LPRPKGNDHDDQQIEKRDELNLDRPLNDVTTQKHPGPNQEGPGRPGAALIEGALRERKKCGAHTEGSQEQIIEKCYLLPDVACTVHPAHRTPQ
jgi:hypothetical protein